MQCGGRTDDLNHPNILSTLTLALLRGHVGQIGRGCSANERLRRGLGWAERGMRSSLTSGDGHNFGGRLQPVAAALALQAAESAGTCARRVSLPRRSTAVYRVALLQYIGSLYCSI